MRQIRLDKPSTVYISFIEGCPRYFELVDVNNWKVYYFRHLDGKTKRIKFNIVHPGEYVSDIDFNVVKIEKIRTPFNLPKLPEPDRDRVKPIEVILNEDLQGTPATIYTLDGIIEVSSFFLELPKPIQDFLLFHEYAHLFYSDEFNCDLFALVACLRKGYNRSMCFYALHEILSKSDENMERIKSIFNRIQETQNKSLWLQ